MKDTNPQINHDIDIENIENEIAIEIERDMKNTDIKHNTNNNSDIEKESHIDKYQRIGGNYSNLYNAAEVLQKPPAKIIGRDSEEIRRGLRNPEKANIVLLGEPGSGKTAAVQDFAYSKGSEESYLVLEVNPEKVISASEDRDSALLRGFRAIVDEAGEYSRDNDVIVVLFIDEFHKLAMFSPSLIEALKPILEKSALNNFRIIASTTFEEYNEWIASKNRALDQRFLRITLSELPKEVIIKILGGRAEKHGVEHLLSPTILEDIYSESKRILISNSQPRASIDILLSMIGETIKDEWMEDGVLKRTFLTPEELKIASDYSLSRPLLKKIIQRTHSIDIDNKVNTHNVKEDLVAKLYNQDQAIDTVMGYLEIAAVGFSDPERPKFSFLSTGSTGVGKAIDDNELVPIYTDSGENLYKRHGDLEVGDYVFDRTGKPTKVTGVYPQGMQKAYKIILSDGSETICNDEHLWTYKSCEGNEVKDWKTSTLRELIEKGIYTEHDGGIKSFKFDIPNNGAVERKPYAFNRIEPYIMGIKLSLQSKGNRIPEKYKGGSIAQRSDLIRGLFGTKDKISSISQNLLEDVQDVLKSLGVSSLINKEELGYNLHVQKRFDTLSISDIVDLNEKRSMTCIMVDNDEHLYQVGKGHIVTHNTELAKIVSESMRIPLKRFDMSRYAAEADAGIFANDLFQAAWSAPNAYILIDEVEKSSRQAMNILLQVLDDARLTDVENPDRLASFSGNIINLTTNLGSEVYQSMQKHQNENDRVDTELIYKALSESEVFETAVLGRIDAIVPFRPLPYSALKMIAKQTLQDILDIGQTRKRKIIVSDDIIPYIVKDRTSMDTERGGARDVKRNIKNLVARELAHEIANEKEETPIIIYLEGEARFKYKDVVDAFNARVAVKRCHSCENTDKLLDNISCKIGIPLVNDGLYLRKDVSMKDHARDIIQIVKDGYYKLTTIIDDDIIEVRGVE